MHSYNTIVVTVPPIYGSTKKVCQAHNSCNPDLTNRKTKIESTEAINCARLQICEFFDNCTDGDNSATCKTCGIVVKQSSSKVQPTFGCIKSAVTSAKRL
ncbi:unnamed protein product [Clavelina lepadiformis]|uniref:Uncharacterized protein n=1 Tax=Clavelina lepadiformis TaxID=159417 RepID=A0ABP0H664_CLALP